MEREKGEWGTAGRSVGLGGKTSPGQQSPAPSTHHGERHGHVALGLRRAPELSAVPEALAVADFGDGLVHNLPGGVLLLRGCAHSNNLQSTTPHQRTVSRQWRGTSLETAWPESPGPCRVCGRAACWSRSTSWSFAPSSLASASAAPASHRARDRGLAGAGNPTHQQQRPRHTSHSNFLICCRVRWVRALAGRG